MFSDVDLTLHKPFQVITKSKQQSTVKEFHPKHLKSNCCFFVVFLFENLHFDSSWQDKKDEFHEFRIDVYFVYFQIFL